MTDDEIIESLHKDRNRLIAGLELIRAYPGLSPYCQRLADATIAGLDVRNPEQRRAIALGKWKPEPTPGQGRVG